jgi:hypothetical protein
MNAKQPENPKGSTTSSARIRDNQRRSRTRRKEYVHDLEQRLRSFERLGVAATEEVQAAGRKVAAENTLLRSLLRLHGVTETQVNQYLESQGPLPRSIPPPNYSAPSPKSENSLQIPQSPPPTTYHRSPAVQSYKDLTNTSHELRPDRFTSTLADINDTNVNVLDNSELGAGRASIVTPGAAEPESGSRQSDLHQGRGLLTSCVTAERIIKSMQAHSESRDVRSELGCDTEGDCMVKNMSIFDVLDKSEG